jgi:hypothetical protein
MLGILFCVGILLMEAKNREKWYTSIAKYAYNFVGLYFSTKVLVTGFKIIILKGHVARNWKIIF